MLYIDLAKNPKEIIRPIQYSRLGSKRHYLDSSIVSREFSLVNVINFILAEISLTGILLLSRHVSFWNLLHCTNHS